MDVSYNAHDIIITAIGYLQQNYKQNIYFTENVIMYTEVNNNNNNNNTAFMRGTFLKPFKGAGLVEV